MCLRCVNACDAAIPSGANGRANGSARGARVQAPGAMARHSARRRPAAANSKPSSISRTRGRGRKTVVSTRDQTGLVAGHAIPTDNRARFMDHTSRDRADLPLQGGATITDTAHAPGVVIGINLGNARQRRLGFQTEPRPLRRIGTTRPTGSAIFNGKRGRIFRVGGVGQRRRALRAA
jgi:hypothetical protein